MPDFRLQPYLNAIKTELVAFGFDVEVDFHLKSTTTDVESAFIKGGTRVNFLTIVVPGPIADKIQHKQTLRIKIEIDTNPPGDFQIESLPQLLPLPHSVVVFQKPDLFAGKIHAILRRSWKNRVKGRDHYDFLWYLARDTPVHLAHLEARLRQVDSSGTAGWTGAKALTLEDVRSLMEVKFRSLDWESAKSDVRVYIKDPAPLDLWSTEFFTGLLSRLRGTNA